MRHPSPNGLHEARPGGNRLRFLLLLVLTPVGCSPRVEAPVSLATDPIPIVARQPVDESPGVIELRVGDTNRGWTIRTLVRDLGRNPLADPVALRRSLQPGVVWNPPYLFVRESNPDTRASRAQVDHVFKVTSGRLECLGTVSARTGPPGSQVRGARFLDVYDRLESTSLTDQALAPTFVLVLEERDGHFVVNRDETWAEGRSKFDTTLGELRTLAEHPDRVQSPASVRQARALALFCLAFTRYCERDDEFGVSRDLAQRALGDVADVIEEVETVVPGELAASRDGVLRANPGLLNLFKESPDTSQELPAIPLPPPSPEP